MLANQYFYCVYIYTKTMSKLVVTLFAYKSRNDAQETMDRYELEFS